ncbi:hypothetical protein [Herbaspirillum seropedicae]|uniref:hypothetical protein n=1 Tax=Herbaspirillum seropedicae TaxID=964 RepID=UPI003D990F15
MDAYWKLEWAVIQLTSPEKEYPRDQYWPVFRIFSCLSDSFSSHASKSDLFKITNFDDWFIHELSERTTFVFESYFRGSIPNMHTRLEYANPLLEGENSSASERQFKKLPAPVARTVNGDQSELAFQQGRLDSETHTQCLEIIYKNLSYKMQWSAQSFLAILHNDHRLDLDAYWQLEWAVLWLTKGGDKASSPHGWPAHRIFTLVTSMLYAHFDPDENFKIDEMSNERVRAFLKRINVVFDAFFKMQIPDLKAFEEANPLLG